MSTIDWAKPIHWLRSFRPTDDRPCPARVLDVVTSGNKRWLAVKFPTIQSENLVLVDDNGQGLNWNGRVENVPPPPEKVYVNVYERNPWRRAAHLTLGTEYLTRGDADTSARLADRTHVLCITKTHDGKLTVEVEEANIRV